MLFPAFSLALIFSKLATGVIFRRTKIPLQRAPQTRRFSLWLRPSLDSSQVWNPLLEYYMAYHSWSRGKLLASGNIFCVVLGISSLVLQTAGHRRVVRAHPSFSNGFPSRSRRVIVITNLLGLIHPRLIFDRTFLLSTNRTYARRSLCQSP
jgi:hypothetical protein